MAPLRSRYLSCFYCGKRSGSRFDGVTRQFTCKHCDATNYLDENGEITDPPVATEHVAPAAPTGSLQASPPRQTTSSSIFCSTCVKNQRLFMASLAQYTPSNGGDDIELDREYYRFRRNLEKRYPQVCAACEAAASEAIQRAEYTAKTDHLRKMMELSRSRRRGPPIRKTWADWVHTMARTAWFAGLVLQMLWHAKLVAGILRLNDSGMADPDDTSAWKLVADRLAWGVSYLPAEETLLWWSVAISLVTAWWNPRLVQVVRGYTKQLSGFRKWYMAQTVICCGRLALGWVSLNDYPRNAQLGAHAVAAFLTIYIYFAAPSWIKTDTTPLFAPHSGTVSPPRDGPGVKMAEPMTLEETLDEVLQTPSVSTPSRPQMDNYYDGLPTPTLSSPATQHSVDEMEWTPTMPTTLPRALKDSPSSADGSFGQAPTHEGSGPFYFKTPPAPTNPARRLRNPPNQPVFWASSEKENTDVPFRRGGRTAATDDAAERVPTRSKVEFARQHYFAPRAESEEDESLADLLGRGFRLDEERPARKTGGWFNWR